MMTRRWRWSPAPDDARPAGCDRYQEGDGGGDDDDDDDGDDAWDHRPRHLFNKLDGGRGGAGRGGAGRGAGVLRRLYSKFMFGFYFCGIGKFGRSALSSSSPSRVRNPKQAAIFRDRPLLDTTSLARLFCRHAERFKRRKTH